MKPQLPDAYAQRGLMRLLRNRADEAQTEFDRCLELNPKLRQLLEQLIAKAEQQIATKR